MKEHLIFLTLLTLVLAGCVSEEKIQNRSGESNITGSPVLANDRTAEEKADETPYAEIFNNLPERTGNNPFLENANANEDLRENLNKELEEAAKKRDAQTITLPTVPPTSSTTQAEAIDNAVTGSKVKVEVYHFHGSSQCVSCRTVGAYAEETVNTYFSQELKDGRLIFAHVNYDLPENKALAEKYGVTGSSLWIGTYVDGKFSKEENVNVWYKINNKGDYLSYLKGVITAKLA